jgi:hypothetical protein
MMENEPKKMTAWRCANGHELGCVRRNGRKITQLLLYRHAINVKDDRPDDLDVIAVIEGYVVDVRCSVPGCNALRTWVPGEAALNRLLASHKRLLAGLETEE